MYDDIYRLTNVNETNSGTLLESFNYDDVGNRINNFNSKTGSGANYDYETNILNQYTSLSGSTLSGSINYTYDNNGNLKNNGTFEFSYDYKNRLTKVETSSGIIVQYSYDVLNRRSILRQGYEGQVKETKYIYSNENILQEITTDETTNTTTTKNYINGIGLDDLIAYEENNDIYFYHKNHLGSVEGISDNMGNLVVSYEYDSFGNFEITSGTDNGNTRLYTGREFDSEIGLYYLRARYYDSKLGRFISRDPIDIADDVNLYAYVGNNPVMYTDPLGTEKKLQNDIDNKNTFLIELVARKVQATNLGVHTYILITSKDKDNNINKYSIGGHNVNGKLVGKFNDSSDLLWDKDSKGNIYIEPTSLIASYNFTQIILDEFNDYNNNNQKKYKMFSAKNSYSDFGNCNNFSTTILYRASGNDESVLDSISNFNPFGANPGLGEYFSY